MFFGLEHVPEDSSTDSINNIYLNGVRVAAMAENGALAYYLTDQVDSVSHVLDDQAETLTRIQYKPYGETFVHEGDQDFAPKYNSQELDSESKLYYFNARHYDPQVARFASADKVVPGAMNTQSWNRFSYVLGNPIKFKDPTGHAPCAAGIMDSCGGLSNSPLVAPRPGDANFVGPTRPGGGGSAVSEAPKSSRQTNIPESVKNEITAKQDQLLNQIGPKQDASTPGFDPETISPLKRAVDTVNMGLRYTPIKGRVAVGVELEAEAALLTVGGKGTLQYVYFGKYGGNPDATEAFYGGLDGGSVHTLSEGENLMFGLMAGGQLNINIIFGSGGHAYFAGRSTQLDVDVKAYAFGLSHSKTGSENGWTHSPVWNQPGYISVDQGIGPGLGIALGYHETIPLATKGYDNQWRLGSGKGL